MCYSVGDVDSDTVAMVMIQMTQQNIDLFRFLCNFADIKSKKETISKESIVFRIE